MLFLQSGYLGTSMDEIAALAGVSKQTVYKHFEDKQRLFAEIVISSVNEVSDPNTSEVQSLGAGDDVEAELRDLARGQLSARDAAEAAAAAPARDRRVGLAFPSSGARSMSVVPGERSPCWPQRSNVSRHRESCDSTIQCSRQHTSTG